MYNNPTQRRKSKKILFNTKISRSKKDIATYSLLWGEKWNRKEIKKFHKEMAWVYI